MGTNVDYRVEQTICLESLGRKKTFDNTFFVRLDVHVRPRRKRGQMCQTEGKEREEMEEGGEGGQKLT